MAINIEFDKARNYFTLQVSFDLHTFLYKIRELSLMLTFYDIFLGVCFLIGGVFLMGTENLGTFDWSSVVGSSLMTITIVDIARRSWYGWQAYKKEFEEQYEIT